MHWTEYKTDTSLPPRKQVRRALASGAFEQTTGTLHHSTVDSFCCLGVACIIAEQNGVAVARYLDEPARVRGGDIVVDQSAVADWLGITPRQQATRITWNDTDRLTFAQIAKKF
jgi:hypothetical protein